MSALLRHTSKEHQAGATAVELAIVLAVFLGIVFGVLEFGRLFYLMATVQEVTRHAARQQVVNWSSQTATIQRTAVFGTGDQDTVLPAGGEVSNLMVRISFHSQLSDAFNNQNPVTPAGGSTPQSNFDACLLGNNTQCIRYVRATLRRSNGTPEGAPVLYTPMLDLFSFLDVELPGSTVVMPAESLGLP